MRVRSRGIVWAVAVASGVARHITEVKTGLACGCVCPGCDMPLEAVNSENPQWKRRPHFRHEKSPELPTCVRSAVLTGARTLLASATEILLPALKVEGQARTPGGQMFYGVEELPEQRVGITRLSFLDETDALLILEDGREIRVRLVASARVGDESLEGPLADITIDVFDLALQDMDPETLRRHITLDADGAKRRWCNQNASDLMMKAQAKAQSLADAYWAFEQKRKERAAAMPKPAPVNLPSPQSKWSGDLGERGFSTAGKSARSMTWRASIPDIAAVERAAAGLATRTGVTVTAVMTVFGRIRKRSALSGVSLAGSVEVWSRELGVPEREVEYFLAEAGYAMVM